MDRKEIIDFYNKHRVWLYNVSYRITGDSMVSEEIMHDTLLAWLMPKSGSNVEAASMSGYAVNGWLKRVCINRSIDWLRRKRGDIFISTMPEKDLHSVEDEMDDVMRLPEMVSLIKKSISRMEAPYSIIMDLVLIEGLSYVEVSEITGVKETTLRSQYSRAVTMLKNDLKSYGRE